MTAAGLVAGALVVVACSTAPPQSPVEGEGTRTPEPTVIDVQVETQQTGPEDLAGDVRFDGVVDEVLDEAVRLSGTVTTTLEAGPLVLTVGPDGQRRFRVAQRPSQPQDPAPLIFIDGVEATTDRLEELGATMDPSDIESIEVIRGPYAAEFFGERAIGGVIQITTIDGPGVAPPEPEPEPGPAPNVDRAPEPEPAPEPPLEPAPEPTPPAPSAEPAPAPTPEPVPAPPQDSLALAPTFTPYDAAPEILNRDEIALRLRVDSENLRDAGIGGRTILHFFVDEGGGAPRRVLVAETSGNAELDSAAVRVGRTFEFAPARNQGSDVPVWIQLPVAFEVP